MKLNNVQIDLIRNCIDRAITVIEHVRNVSTGVEGIEGDSLAIRSLISVSINDDDSKDKLMTEIALNFRIDSTDFEKCEYHFDDGFTAQQVGSIENVDEKIKEIKDEIEKELEAAYVPYQTYWILAEHEEDFLYVETSNFDSVAGCRSEYEILKVDESNSKRLKIDLKVKYEGLELTDQEGFEVCCVDGSVIFHVEAEKTESDHRNFYELDSAETGDFSFAQDREVYHPYEHYAAKLVVEKLSDCMHRTSMRFAFSSDDYV